MHLKKLSFKNSFAVTLLLLCFVNEAFSLQCYFCSSGFDDECDRNPKQNKYAQSCIPNSASSMDQFSTARKQDYGGYYCIKLTDHDRHTVTRTCAPKGYTCERMLQDYNQNYNLRSITCNRCETDYCNSSSNLSVGLLSFAASMITIFYSLS